MLSFCERWMALVHLSRNCQRIFPIPLLNKFTIYEEFDSIKSFEQLKSEAFSLAIMKPIISASKAKQTPRPQEKQALKKPREVLKIPAQPPSPENQELGINVTFDLASWGEIPMNLNNRVGFTIVNFNSQTVDYNPILYIIANPANIKITSITNRSPNRS